MSDQLLAKTKDCITSRMAGCEVKVLRVNSNGPLEWGGIY